MLLTTLRRTAPRRSAFTLMEVLVVVAILVILAGVAIIQVPKYIEEARKSKAHLACQSIATAAEAYHLSPSNTTNEYPTSAEQLIQPPFGGTSFLKNGTADATDPWGKRYTIEPQQKSDGTTYILVHTTASDKTEISNFGFGQASRPQN